MKTAVCTYEHPKYLKLKIASNPIFQSICNPQPKLLIESAQKNEENQNNP
jgi:hypothetical protein